MLTKYNDSWTVNMLKFVIKKKWTGFGRKRLWKCEIRVVSGFAQGEIGGSALGLSTNPSGRGRLQVGFSTKRNRISEKTG